MIYKVEHHICIVWLPNDPHLFASSFSDHLARFPPLFNRLAFCVCPFALLRQIRPLFVFSWDFLEVETNGDFTDNEQAYAAGLVEAYLTKDLVIMHWKVSTERLMNVLLVCS